MSPVLLLLLLAVGEAGRWAQCGVLGKSRKHRPEADIVHGRKSTKCEWRWQVSLRNRQTANSSSRHFCGGTLISPQWVLTAAHCVVDINDCNKHTLRVVAGDFKQKWEGDRYQVEMGVKQVFVHHEYSQHTEMDQDFALIELAEPMPIGRCIGVACLPSNGSVASVGEKCNITGWGTLKSGGHTPENLQEAPVTVLSNEECKASYGHGEGNITDAMLCAQGHSRKGITDSCQGDSGGPLVCKEDRRFVLHGVVSWGNGCADVSYPGVYSRVSHQLDWIQAVMSGSLPTSTPPPRPANYNGSMWAVMEGSCQMDEQHCITSPNYPENYSNYDSCKIAVNVSAAVPLDVKDWATEAWYDKLNIGCEVYTGAQSPQGVTPNGDIAWDSDASVTERGWKICPSTEDTSIVFP